MEKRFNGIVVTLILFLVQFPVEVMLLEVSTSKHRVIFQSFEMPDGDTVQCYGSCLQNSKIDVTNCDGRRIRVACQSSVIDITRATAGKLSPDLDLCNYKKRIECRTNVTNTIRTICNNKRDCTIDVTKNHVQNKCKDDKHVAIDIIYKCRPIQTTTKIFSTLKTSTHVIKTTQTTKISRKHDPLTKSTIITKPVLKTTVSTPDARLIVPDYSRRQKSKDEYWILFAYGAIMDNEYIRSNKTHLALVILLSMFLGLVLCLCICLDYCRRSRRQKKDIKSNWNLVEVTDAQLDDYNERIELINSKLLEESKQLVDDKEKPCGNNEDGDVFVNMSVTAPFLHKNGVLDEKRFFSPRSQITLPSLHVHPPSCNYDGDNTGTIHSDSSTICSVNSRKSMHRAIPEEKYNSEMSEIKEVFGENGDMMLSDCGEYEYIEVEGYHDCDNFSDNTQVAYHETENYLVPKKFASLNRRPDANDVTAGNEPVCYRTLEPKRIRRIPHHQKDCSVIQKSTSLDGPKMKCCHSNISSLQRCSNNNNTQQQEGARNSKRVHVMPRCHEPQALRNSNNKYTHSDNEVSRRRLCNEGEHQRACKYYHGHNTRETTINDYCNTCGKSEESHLKCDSSLTSNCQSSSHDEYSTDHGPLLSISNELIKNKKCCVEESGYQSHDTGTDSLCSSSTDHEDSRVFLPNSGHHCNCHQKKSHEINSNNRSHTSKRGPKQTILGDQNNKTINNNNNCNSNNKTRRARRDGNNEYIKCDTQSSNEVNSYDSSMDESSSRDSVRVYRRIRKQNDDQNNEMKSIKYCSCNCGNSELKNTDGRLDGIETS